MGGTQSSAAAAQAVAAPASQSVWRPDHRPPAPVALCIVGQLRTLSYSWVQERFEHAVLRPLEWPTIFMHVSREGGCQSRSGRSCAASLTTQVDLDTILQRLPLVSLTLLDDVEILRRHRLMNAHNPSSGAWICPGGSCLPMLLRMSGCADDVERFEAARSHRFSYVMRTRPDLYWRCSLPALSTLHMALHVPASATKPAPGAAMLHRDWFSLSTRNVGLAMLRLTLTISAADRRGCRARGLHEHHACMDATLAAANASWCDLPLGERVPAHVQRVVTGPQAAGRNVGHEHPLEGRCHLCVPRAGSTDRPAEASDVTVVKNLQKQLAGQVIRRQRHAHDDDD